MIKMPVLNKNKGEPSKKITSVSHLTEPVQASETVKLNTSPSHITASVSSPLRQRLKQRIQENTIEIVEEKEEKQKKSSSKKSSNSTATKKIPKVFASPSWFKSPKQKRIQTKNKQFDELRDLFRKDGTNTEEGINKIINDLKF